MFLVSAIGPQLFRTPYCCLAASLVFVSETGICTGKDVLALVAVVEEDRADALSTNLRRRRLFLSIVLGPPFQSKAFGPCEEVFVPLPGISWRQIRKPSALQGSAAARLPLLQPEQRRPCLYKQRVPLKRQRGSRANASNKRCMISLLCENYKPVERSLRVSGLLPPAKRAMQIMIAPTPQFHAHLGRSPAESTRAPTQVGQGDLAMYLPRQ